MSLSEKSDEEISRLLSEYGIRHGPIVDSTRRLYEKKLEAAMEDAPVAPSSDKTYYREEAEEITYFTYHSPVRQEADVRDTTTLTKGNMKCYDNLYWLKRRGNAEPAEDEESEEDDIEPPVQVTNRTANHSAGRSKEVVRKSGGGGGGVWKAIRLLLLLAVLAAVLYYAYCRVMSSEEK